MQDVERLTCRTKPARLAPAANRQTAMDDNTPNTPTPATPSTTPSPSAESTQSSTQRPSSTTFDFQDRGQQALGKAKEVANTTKNAVLTLLSDPIGGQQTAITKLGPLGTLQAGGVLVGAFVLVSLLAALLAASALGPWMGGVKNSLTSGALVGSLIFAAALFGSIWAASKFFGQTPLSPITTLFTTGVSLLPYTISILLGIITVKLGLYSISMLLSLVAATLLVLLVNNALVKLSGMAERTAFLLTPAVLVVTAIVVTVLT